jgi:hypothetical protein
LRDILAKSDGLPPPDSTNDWITGLDAENVALAVSDLIADLVATCGTCT